MKSSKAYKIDEANLTVDSRNNINYWSWSCSMCMTFVVVSIALVWVYGSTRLFETGAGKMRIIPHWITSLISSFVVYSNISHSGCLPRFIATSFPCNSLCPFVVSRPPFSHFPCHDKIIESSSVVWWRKQITRLSMRINNKEERTATLLFAAWTGKKDKLISIFFYLKTFNGN